MTDRRQLGIQDALWLEMDRPNNLMVVDSVIWTAGPLDWERVRAVVAERLAERYPVFRSRAEKDEDGTWWWVVAEDFDLDDHVTLVELDDPDDPRALQRLVASRRTQMLDRSRPLWEGVWVDRYLSGSAMILRTHHAIADGMRMVEMSLRLFDGSPDGEPLIPQPVRQHGVHENRPGERGGGGSGDPLARVTGAVGGAVGSAVGGAVSAVGAVGGVVSGAAGAMGSVVTDAAGRVGGLVGGLVGGAVTDAVRGLPGAVSGGVAMAKGVVTNPVGTGHTLVTSATASAAQLADSEPSALGSTVRSTLPGGGPLVDLFSAAPGDVDITRKLLLGTRNDATVWTGHAGDRKGVAWSEPIPLADIKAVARANEATVNDVLVSCVAGALHAYLEARHAHCASVTFMVPVNLRPFDPTLPDDLGNGFALVQLELPTDQPDPLQVLATAKHRMDRIKHGHEAAIAFRVQETIAGLSRTLYEASVDLLANRNVGVLTNVPGPQVPVYLAGRRVEGICGWAPLSGDQPMSFTIYSYDGRVIVGIACDQGLVPDHETIVDGFADAFRRLAAVSPHPTG